MRTVFHCTLAAKINASKIVLYHETVYNHTEKNLIGNHVSKCLVIQELDFGLKNTSD